MMDRRDVLRLALSGWTDDVKKNFSGRIIVAKDLMELSLPVLTRSLSVSLGAFVGKRTQLSERPHAQEQDTG
jgi:hypothetical protein